MTPLAPWLCASPDQLGHAYDTRRAGPRPTHLLIMLDHLARGEHLAAVLAFQAWLVVDLPKGGIFSFGLRSLPKERKRAHLAAWSDGLRGAAARA